MLLSPNQDAFPLDQLGFDPDPILFCESRARSQQSDQKSARLHYLCGGPWFVLDQSSQG